LSELRSAVEALRSETLPDHPDARLEEDFAELQQVCELLELERLRRLAEIERRRLFERDGHLSAASWLAARFRIAWGTARGQTRLARALAHMPGTRHALEAGDVSLSAARVLVAARDGLDDQLRARRRLHASVSFEGMVRVDGDLDPEAGETLLTALRAVMDAGSRNGSDDNRTPPQRRADALHEICRQWLDLAERPTVAGERPHVTVTVDAPALAGASSGAGDLDHVGAVDVTFARQLSCDASVMRVVMAGRSQPLDVGRRTPVVPPAIRRAVIVRDRVCRFPGCDRPHTWCDAHHIVHWADGGSTSLHNLLLLCRRHHGMIHRREGFRLNLEDGVPIFRRCDGTLLDNPVPLQRLAG
jgi:hypothetical protein